MLRNIIIGTCNRKAYQQARVDNRTPTTSTVITITNITDPINKIPNPQAQTKTFSRLSNMATTTSAPSSGATPKTLIKQGAEAHLYYTTFLTPFLPCLLKHRPSKPYRHPLLDTRLTKHRCLSEARLLVRMRREMDKARITSSAEGGSGAHGEGEGGGDRRDGGGTVPAVYFVDEARGEIYMEWIEGRTVRDVLDGVLHRRDKDNSNLSPAAAETEPENNDANVQRALTALMHRIGRTVATMHSADVVHGDLTTSNIMLRSPGGSTNSPDANSGFASEAATDLSFTHSEIVLIDFGLGSVSTSDEDMAVDLYVLERAFISTHPRAEKLFSEVLRGYEEGVGKKRGTAVLRRLAEVRMRGRKRSMVG
ncbi:hypothetical protein BDZ91DRAFT_717098 [Kalaharituber pfeilii]|nr:hypothetical protein BDZ91DRAFT_717098 [Kalaharituber pfeilii]